MARLAGVFAEPAGSAAVAGLVKDVALGVLDKSSNVVCVSTGHGLKDPDVAISQSVKPMIIDATIEALERLLEER